MPYTDPEKQRQAQRESYRRRYEASEKFRREEAERKAAWLESEEGKAKNAEASARAREKAAAKKTAPPPKRGKQPSASLDPELPRGRRGGPKNRAQ
jgi:ribonuclease HI